MLKFAAIAVGIITAVICFWVLREQDETLEPDPDVAGAARETGGERETRRRRGVEDAGELPAPGHDAGEEPDEPVGTPEPGDAATPPEPPGLVRLRVVDRTGRDLEAVRVRAVSARRVVEGRKSSPLELRLPGGPLALVLHKAGYEREKLDIVVSRGDEPTDLGTVVLERGDAAIDGRLELGATGAAVAEVHLHGAGRSPLGPAVCEREGHDAPGDGSCRRCGWSRSHSQVIPSGDSFRFERLAGGPYLLVARDAEGLVLATQRVVLEPHEVRTVVMRIEFRDVFVRIEDRDGQPFDGLWNEDGLWYSSKIRIMFWSDGVCSAAAEVSPADAGYAVNRDPVDETPKPRARATHLDVDLGLEQAAKERERMARDAARGRREPPEPLARPRRTGEGLWPKLPSPTPHLKTRPLPAARTGAGLYSIRRVPVRATRTLASCGPIFTHTKGIDLVKGSSDPIVLVMHRRCGADTRILHAMAAGPRPRVKCTACHALPADVFE